MGKSMSKCYCSLSLFWVLLFIIWRLLSNVEADSEKRDVFLFQLRGDPLSHLFTPDQIQDTQSEAASDYAASLIDGHNALLDEALGSGTHQKLYSYHYLVNGFAAYLSSPQAKLLASLPDVLFVERDRKVQKSTTYTPWYLGLPNGAWAEEGGGGGNAGEGIIIGIVDTGIDPMHPSFSDNFSRDTTNGANNSRVHPYGEAPAKFKGFCEVAPEFPKGSCNKKLIGARHFAAAAIQKGAFNTSQHFASPLDEDGHGTHTASIAAGNSGVPVIVAGSHYGSASGMAPRAHLAIYKALYRNFGGYYADVVAAVEQAAQDGIDVLSLSIAPSKPAKGVATFFSLFDTSLLSAVKSGIFVTQAAGNSGPSYKTIQSYSPWVFSVASSLHDRTYSNSMLLANNITIYGIGLAPSTQGSKMYNLVLAKDASSKGYKHIKECQDPSIMAKEKVEGRVLVCTYTRRFMSGDATVSKVVATAHNLSAQGVVLLATLQIDGKAIRPTPFSIPAIIIPSYNDSQALMEYYHSLKGRAMVRIIGGNAAKFSHESPKVAIYSSRGPDILDYKLSPVDILKPNIMAPGTSIWASWSAFGTDFPEFQGERFALLSGTSMSTPHIAGIAALVKQKYSKLSPSAISSALSTTASVLDSHGNPILVENSIMDATKDVRAATPFDFGGGLVNPTAALNPGLVFDAGFEDYVKFLCSIEGSSRGLVRKRTGSLCPSPGGGPNKAGVLNLNVPSITVANLVGPVVLARTLTNIATQPESYTSSIVAPRGLLVHVQPSSFHLRTSQSQPLSIHLTPTATSNYTFGTIVFCGNRGHIVRIPLSILYMATNA